MNANFVSVVIPTYDEGKCIQRDLEKVVNYLRSRFSLFEVIVVDDGSQDDSARKVRPLRGLLRVLSELLRIYSNDGRGLYLQPSVER